MSVTYRLLQHDLTSELHRSLEYWSTQTPDRKNGGFYGKIDHWNNVVPKASKGIILNTRILWAFSAASNHLATEDYRRLCDLSFSYINTYFKDTVHGGVFWEVDYKANPINKRKQIYAQAFAIYALSEYYEFTKNDEAKQWAIQLYAKVEEVARDKDKGGYFEAFDEDWSGIQDVRLSPKDMNAAKTMNTHLHLLEAYTRLADIYDSADLKESLEHLVILFQGRFLNTQQYYTLFFTEDWKVQSNTISYGHDIETVWLVIEATKRLKNPILLKQAWNDAIQVADKFVQEAIDTDNGVINEKNLDNGSVDKDKHWWPQMEALVGLKYVYEHTKNPNYLEVAMNIWDFTKHHLIDHTNGEWHFRVNDQGVPYTEEDKVSMWKAPYHIVRACIVLNTID